MIQGTYPEVVGGLHHAEDGGLKRSLENRRWPRTAARIPHTPPPSPWRIQRKVEGAG